MDKGGMMEHLMEPYIKYLQYYMLKRQKVKAWIRETTPANCEDSEPQVMGYACNPDFLLRQSGCNFIWDCLNLSRLFCEAFHMLQLSTARVMNKSVQGIFLFTRDVSAL